MEAFLPKLGLKKTAAECIEKKMISMTPLANWQKLLS